MATKSLKSFPIPANEKNRLNTLYESQILDSLKEIEFDRITKLASLICNVPISLITFIDQDRQWIKSNVGFDLIETKRSSSFCQYAIMSDELFEIKDASNDDRFKDNEFVTGDTHFRFYAGTPLLDKKGFALGSLCVIDKKPKRLNENQKKSLQLLANEVIILIEERRQKLDFQSIEKLFNSTNDLVCIAGTDGSFKKVNPSFKNRLGWETDYLLQTSYFSLIHPDDVSITEKEVEKLAKGESTINFIHRFRTSQNDYKVIQWMVTPEVKTGKLYAIGRDITLEKEQADRLAISEHNLKVFFENSKGFLNTFDLKGNFLSGNDAFINQIGFSKEELFELGVKAIIPEQGADADERIQIFFSEIQKKKVIHNASILKHKNGSLMHWTYSATLVENPFGENYVIINAIDITERYNLEIKLKHTKEILEETNTIAKIGGWSYDVQEKKLYWTSVVKKMLRVPEYYEPELLKDTQRFKEGESRDKVLLSFREAFKDLKSFDIEIIVVDDSGQDVWVRMLGKSEHENGICKRIHGTFQDINEKKIAELALNSSRKFFDDVLNAATEVSIIAVDINHNVTIFNTGAEKMLGYEASEMIGNTPITNIHLNEEITQRSEQLTQKYGYPVTGFRVIIENAEKEGSEQHEWTYVRKDGTHLKVQLVVTAMRDKQNNLIGFLGIATDITDLEIAKGNLEILANQLQKQNTKLLNFAHITSHNLRAPVSNLNSLLYFYNESEDQDDKQLLFSKFETVTHHLTTTLNELIESLKIQEDLGKEKETIYFDDILNKTQEILTAQLMSSKAIITSDFSEINTILYPKTYIESIMLNLFTNAIKYASPDRIPKIHFQTKLNHDKVILSVSDNGLGIDLKKNGDKLFGLNKTFHRHPDAKGIGLFITKTQVEAMGGEISAESEVGKGTTFTIILN